MEARKPIPILSPGLRQVPSELPPPFLIPLLRGGFGSCFLIDLEGLMFSYTSLMHHDVSYICGTSLAKPWWRYLRNLPRGLGPAGLTPETPNQEAIRHGHPLVIYGRHQIDLHTSTSRAYTSRVAKVLVKPVKTALPASSCLSLGFQGGFLAWRC